jgi:transposase
MWTSKTGASTSRRVWMLTKYFLHKASITICQNHATVIVEDLQVKNMSKSAAGTIQRRSARCPAHRPNPLFDAGRGQPNGPAVVLSLCHQMSASPRSTQKVAWWNYRALSITVRRMLLIRVE